MEFDQTIPDQLHVFHRFDMLYHVHQSVCNNCEPIEMCVAPQSGPLKFCTYA